MTVISISYGTGENIYEIEGIVRLGIGGRTSRHSSCAWECRDRPRLTDQPSALPSILRTNQIRWTEVFHHLPPL
jgi:hypothetical protein